jgi:hypothetical protein
MYLLLIFFTIFYLNISALRNSYLFTIIICYNRYFFVTFVKYHLMFLTILNYIMNLVIDSVCFFIYLFQSSQIILFHRIIIKILIIAVGFYYTIFINLHVHLIIVYLLTSIPFFIYFFIKKKPNNDLWNLNLMEKEFKAFVMTLIIIIDLNYCIYFAIMHFSIVIIIDNKINRKETKGNFTKKSVDNLRDLFARNPILKQKIRHQEK